MDQFFRATDLIMCYWQGGGGVCAWLLERNGQLFSFMIKGNQLGLQVQLTTMASVDRTQVDAFSIAMQQVGFFETPVYMPYEVARKANKMNGLESDINIYLKDVERQKEVIAAAKQEAAKKAEEAEAITTPKAKSKSGNVTPITTKK